MNNDLVKTVYWITIVITWLTTIGVLIYERVETSYIVECALGLGAIGLLPALFWRKMK